MQTIISVVNLHKEFRVFHHHRGAFGALRNLFTREAHVVKAVDGVSFSIRHVNRERGATVILTTHDLSDVEKLCERVMMIDHGHLLFDGQLEELRQRFGGERELVVDLAEDYPDVSVEGARVAERDGLRVTYRFTRGAVTASTLIGRLSARYRLLDLSVREPEIEDTVRRIYEERLLEKPGMTGAGGTTGTQGN